MARVAMGQLSAVDRRRRRSSVVLATLAAVGAGCGAVAVQAASAASAAWTVKRHERTISVPPARTTTVDVAYPDALEFAGAVYSGSVRIVGPAGRAIGTRPRLGLVEVVDEGSAEGGSVLRVRIRNRNPLGTLAARAEITALTREPAVG
jgi:hypothetical protein